MVYRALIDGEQLVQWLPPKGMTGRLLAFEPSVGGAYAIELTYTKGGKGKTSATTDVSRGRFLELIPNTRVVQAGVFESDDPAFAGEMRMTWLLDPRPEGTRVRVTAEHVPPGIDPAEHVQGIASSLDNLAAFIERSAR